MFEAAEIPRLSPNQAYSLWAPSYDEETAVSLLDDQLVDRLSPPLRGRRLLDVGCGTGRRMVTAGAASPTGVEPCAEMIAAGAKSINATPGAMILQGEAGALPVSDAGFDVVWCRLVLGHVAHLARPYAELARAVAPGGEVVVSDFHSEALAQGHRRTFRSPSGPREIENFAHTPADHIAAAETAGLSLVESAEATVGAEVRHLYAAAGRLDDYHRQIGLPLVFALRFERR